MVQAVVDEAQRCGPLPLARGRVKLDHIYITENDISEIYITKNVARQTQTPRKPHEAQLWGHMSHNLSLSNLWIATRLVLKQL